ncbi:MAG: alpha/beta fold hydrolase, partial [Pararhizobium sp.]
AQDGLRLHARDYRPDDPAARARLPVVCLPGLTRNVRDFHRLALFLSQGCDTPRRVVSLDYRGRGLSETDRDPSHYTIVVEAEDALTAMTVLGIERAAFIGTSRGALVIHVLAGMRPAALAAAVLNDAGPAIEGAGLAQIKGYLERMPLPRDWADAARLLREAHGSGFPALSDPDWQEMARAIYAEKNGKPAADYDPAIVCALKDVDFNTRLPTLWPQFEGLARRPLMTIRGEHSTLLSEAMVAEMARRHPGMAIVTAKGQAHPPLLHRDGIAEEIAAFLARNDRQA